jgi:Mg2+-importing ATPase
VRADYRHRLGAPRLGTRPLKMTTRRAVRWLPWLLGAAAVAAVVFVALHAAEERAFVRLLEQARPVWLLWALGLQAATYFAQAEIWRIVLRRAGTSIPFSFACRLSLAKLFIDQAIPSMGISGAIVVARALEKRGAPRPAVMSSVAVDAASFYIAYVINLAVALALVTAQGHASPLILAIAALFFAYGGGLTAAVLLLSGRAPGRFAATLLRVPGIGRIVALLQEASPHLAHDPSLLTRATVLQVVIAVLDAATVWVLIRSLGVTASPAAVFASFMIASVLRSIGFLPGGLGTFEAASVAALTLAGVPVAAGLAATLLFRGLSFWLPMLPGLAFSRSLAQRDRTGASAVSKLPYWSLAPEEVARQLESPGGGLATGEAARRLEQIGHNVVGEREAFSRLSVMWNQLKSPLLLLLVFAAGASMATGEWVDAIIVLAIVVASVGIGYSREYRAQSAAAELRAKVQVHTTVLRDGQPCSVPIQEIVPGDVVLLSAGSVVPADSLLLEAADCFVNEAVLTGESFPVQKTPGPVDAAAPLAKRSNCVHLGTSVRSGSARCLVVTTGEATEFGAIAHRLTLRPPETEFDRGIRHFGYLLTSAMTIMMVVVLAANLLLGRPLIETLLFAIALAVGLSPELLPAILSVNLARGAHNMAAHGVLVRRLNAIENLGSMDVLCTDKTGTLTEGVVQLDGAWDSAGLASARVMEIAATNAALQSGLVNPLDEAIQQAHRPRLDGIEKIAEIPYDFVRKRLSVVVRAADGVRLLTKGAVEQVLAACSSQPDGTIIDDPARARLRDVAAAWTHRGIRVLAVASRAMPAQAGYGRGDERDLVFEGFLTFLDRPKAGVNATLADLGRLGVAVKLSTGDAGPVAQYVASSVGMRADRILTGLQLDELHDDALWHAAENTDLFVEVDPNQKERIILALKKMGHVVGFLGDGINDAPAMHAADTSLSVEGAVDVAREAADFVLLERDLDVIRRGIQEGRRTFANTLKYILTTTSANLGNMISMAVASLFLPFLPLLAGQILLNNFLSDVPAIGLASDAVDPELVDRPRRWNMRFLGRFMVEFGCLSSLFDFLTFGLLLFAFAATPEIFRTGWFVESLLTELVIALVVRTRRPFWRSRPGNLLLWSSFGVMALTFAIPYLPYASLLDFTPLPAGVMLSLIAIAALYVGSTEILKASFYRRRGREDAPQVP